LTSRLVADRDAGQEVRREAAVEAARKTADRVGKGAGVAVAGDGAGAADRAAPRAPQARCRRIAGDVAGFGQRDAAAAAVWLPARLAKLVMKSCAPCTMALEKPA